MVHKIHDVKIIGKLNDKQISVLREIESVTTISDWEGINAVYCGDGVEVNGMKVMGFYQGSISEEISFQDDEGVSHIEKINSSFILLDSTENEQPHRFSFILLHELGHHVDRITNKKTLKRGSKEDEINAHKFALMKYWEMNKGGDIYNMPYLQEAIDELKVAKCVNKGF